MFLLVAVLLAAPERTFEPPGPLTRAFGSTWELSADSDGTGWLVAWGATRRLGVDQPVVMGTRLDALGRVLDPNGLHLSSPFGARPSVAWVPSASAWVVAWEADGESWFRLVRPDGSRSTPSRLGQGRRPTVSPQPPGFVITAEAGEPALWRVQSPMTVLDVTPRTAQSPQLGWATPVLTDGAGTAAWTTGGTLWTVPVDFTSGFGSSPFALKPAASLEGLIIEENVTRFVTRPSQSGGFVTSTASGTIASADLALIDAGAPARAHLSRNVTGGSIITLLFQNGAAWAHLCRDGGVEPAQPLSSQSFLSDLTLSASSTQLLEAASTAYDGVLARRRLPNLATGDDPNQALISTSLGGHWSHLAARQGDQIVFAYQRITSDAELVVRRTDATGTPLGAPELIVSSTRNEQVRLASFGRTAVVYSGESLRFSTAPGRWSTPEPLPRPLLSVGLATDPLERLVITGVAPVAGEYEGWAIRREADGGSTERLIFPIGSPKPVWPQLAFQPDGGEALAISGTSEQVWATRLSADLVPQGDAGFLALGTAISPSVAFDGRDGFFVAFTDYSSVYVARVVRGIARPSVIVREGLFEIGPLVEVPGGALLPIADRQSGALSLASITVGSGGDALVGPALEVVAPSGEFTNTPTLARIEGGLALTYGRLDLDAGVSTVRYQVLPRVGAGGACIADWQCDGPCIAARCPGPGGGSDGGAASGSPQADAGRGESDAGLGPTVDGEPTTGGVRPGRGYRAGCDCSQVDGSPLLISLALLVRRRR